MPLLWRRSRKQARRLIPVETPPPPDRIPPRRRVARPADLAPFPEGRVERRFFPREQPPAPDAAPRRRARFPIFPVVVLRLGHARHGHAHPGSHPVSTPVTHDLRARYADTLERTAHWAVVLDLWMEHPMGGQPSPPEQRLEIIRAQDLTLRFRFATPRGIAGWAVTFMVRKKLTGTAVLTRTVGSGVTLTDTGRGVLTVALAKAALGSLDPSSELADGEGYVWELKRTDSGSEVVLARGELELLREVIS